MCALKAGWLSAGREDEESERAALSAGEMEFYLVESLAVRQEWGRIGSGVTAGRINDKKQPDRINGGRKDGGVCFCARCHEVKRNPCSI